MDCGFHLDKTEGLLCKTPSRRGISRSEPLNLKRMAQIRWGGEGVVVGAVNSGACRRSRGSRRRLAICRFRASLAKARAQGERGTHGELNEGIELARRGTTATRG